MIALTAHRDRLIKVLVAFFNLDLLPEALQFSEDMTDEDLLGAAGYLWALSPNNLWHQVLGERIKAFSKAIFEGEG